MMCTNLTGKNSLLYCLAKHYAGIVSNAFRHLLYNIMLQIMTLGLTVIELQNLTNLVTYGPQSNLI